MWAWVVTWAEIERRPEGEVRRGWEKRPVGERGEVEWAEWGRSKKAVREEGSGPVVVVVRGRWEVEKEGEEGRGRRGRR